MKKKYILLIFTALIVNIVVLYNIQNSQNKEFERRDALLFSLYINQQAHIIKGITETLLLYETDFNDRETSIFQDSISKDITNFSLNNSLIRDLEWVSMGTSNISDVLFNEQIDLTWNRFIVDNDNPNEEFILHLGLILIDVSEELKKIDPLHIVEDLGSETYERLEKIFMKMNEDILELASQYS